MSAASVASPNGGSIPGMSKLVTVKGREIVIASCVIVCTFTSAMPARRN